MSGSIAMAEAPSQAHAAKANSISLIVPGMGSNHCAGLITASLERLPGIESVHTNIATHRVTVRFDPQQTTPEHLQRAIEQAGYEVAAVEKAQGRAAPQADDVEERYLAQAWKRLWIAGVSTTLIMILMAVHMLRPRAA